jgi:hypothetical protein
MLELCVGIHKIIAREAVRGCSPALVLLRVLSFSFILGLEVHILLSLVFGSWLLGLWTLSPPEGLGFGV